MRNPNTDPAVSTEEKCTALCLDRPGLWGAFVVRDYDSEKDTFLIVEDPRYMWDDLVDEGPDLGTVFLDYEDAVIPAHMIHVVTGADTDFEDPNLWVGHHFLMPCCAVNATAD